MKLHNRVDIVLEVLTEDMGMSREELVALRDALHDRIDGARPEQMDHEDRRTLYLPGDALPSFDDE